MTCKPSIGQNLHYFTGNCDVSMSVKNSWMGRKRQTNKSTLACRKSQNDCLKCRRSNSSWRFLVRQRLNSEVVLRNNMSSISYYLVLFLHDKVKSSKRAHFYTSGSVAFCQVSGSSFFWPESFKSETKTRQTRRYKSKNSLITFELMLKSIQIIKIFYISAFHTRNSLKVCAFP